MRSSKPCAFSLRRSSRSWVREYRSGGRPKASRMAACIWWEVHVDVQQLGLKRGEAIRCRQERLSEGVELLEPLVQAKILHPVDTDLEAQEGREFFVQPRHETFAVDAQHMMAMIDLLQHALELAPEALVFANAKDLRDLVGGEAEHAQLTRPFKDLMDRKMPLEHHVAAELDLVE